MSRRTQALDGLSDSDVSVSEEMVVAAKSPGFAVDNQFDTSDTMLSYMYYCTVLAEALVPTSILTGPKVIKVPNKK